MVNPRTLNLMKCKAAKKFKTNLFSVHIVWKLLNSDFTFEENGTFSELCLSIPAKFYDELNILSEEMAQDEQEQGSVELIACPVDAAHEIKPVNPGVMVPILSKDFRIGAL
jgi:hypothetical protein